MGEKGGRREAASGFLSPLRLWSSVQRWRACGRGSSPGVRMTSRPQPAKGRSEWRGRARERLPGGVGRGAWDQGGGRGREGLAGCRPGVGRVVVQGRGVAASRARRPAPASEKGQGFWKGREGDLGNPAAMPHPSYPPAGPRLARPAYLCARAARGRLEPGF